MSDCGNGFHFLGSFYEAGSIGLISGEWKTLGKLSSFSFLTMIAALN